eukprot:gene12226-12364_t
MTAAAECKAATPPAPGQQAAAAAAAGRRKRLLLNDDDTRMAAFDELLVKVTCPPGVRRIKEGRSFNKGLARVRPFMMPNLAAAKLNRPTPLQGYDDDNDNSITGGKECLCPLGVRGERTYPHSIVWGELAAQLAAEGSQLVKGSQLTVKCATGGAPMAQQAIHLKHGADLVVATPGRLVDLLDNKTVSLARTKFMVFDEVDDLMGPSLLPLMRQVLHHPSLLPQQQPAETIPPSVTQRFLGVAPQVKMRCLMRLLASSGAGGGEGLVLIFTNTHAVADEVWRQLDQAGVAAGVLHQGRSQVQRDEALQCFKYGVTQVLVACGIAYRGLDLPDVAQVINYEIPMTAAEYARRLGRAGRAGKPGIGTTLVTPADGGAVGPLVAVLKAGGRQVPEWLQTLADSSSHSGGVRYDKVASVDTADGGHNAGSQTNSSTAVDAGAEVAQEVDRQQAVAVSPLFRIRPRRSGKPQPEFGRYMQTGQQAAAEGAAGSE